MQSTHQGMKSCSCSNRGFNRGSNTIRSTPYVKSMDLRYSESHNDVSRGQSAVFLRSHGSIAIDFLLSGRSCRLESNGAGWTVNCAGEIFSVSYKAGVARAELFDSGQVATMIYEYVNFPTVRLQVLSAGHSEESFGPVSAVARQTMAWNIHAPPLSLLRKFFSEMKQDENFKRRINLAIAASIPFDDYFPFFRKGDNTADATGCMDFCWLCAFAIVGTPGVLFDDIWLCGMCAICGARGSG